MRYVHVVGPDSSVRSVFTENGDKLVDHLEDATVVVLTGGQDISPELYGEKALSSTYFSPWRDKLEIEASRRAQALDIPLVGICRGGQLLNVLNDGSMWQDVNNHHTSHEVYDNVTKKYTRTNSIHHQMMIPNLARGVVIAVANEATEFESEGRRVISHVNRLADPSTWQDVEVVWYEGTKSLCFQAHPEYDTKRGTTRAYFLELMERFDL